MREAWQTQSKPDVDLAAIIAALTADLAAMRQHVEAPLRRVEALEASLHRLLLRIEALEERQMSRALRPADRAHLLRLLPAWAGVIGSAAVTAREVLNKPDAALRVALDGISSPKVLGKLARRALGVPIAGYVLECGGKEAGTSLWTVREVVS